MASKLLYYEGEKVRTDGLHGFLRALAWDTQGGYLIVVGNKGRVMKIQDDRSTVLKSGTGHNLRAVSVNPSDGTSLIVGNSGTALLLDEHERFTKLNMSTFENLRAASWHPNGSLALVAGNNGTLLKYSPKGIETIEAGRANIRDISWRPKSNNALIVSNCFAEEFIPSPSLFIYEAETNIVRPLNEGRADLIGTAWKPTGASALVVGYDVVWHNGFIGEFDGLTLSPRPFKNRGVYPVAVAWDSSSKLAAIVTATGQAGMADGTVFLWDEKSLNPLYTDSEFFFSDVAWDWKKRRFAAVASTETRTFNA